MNKTNAFLQLFSDEAATPNEQFVSTLQKQFMHISLQSPQAARSKRLSTKYKVILVITIVAIVAAVLALVLLPKRDMSDPAKSSVIETVVESSQNSLQSFGDKVTETTAPQQNSSSSPSTNSSGQSIQQNTTEAPQQQPTNPVTSVQGFLAEYWNISSESVGPPSMPAGVPSYSTTVQQLGFNWGAGSPHASVQTDGFVARYSKTVSLASGTYNVVYSSDNGLRMHVNETVVFDKWNMANTSGTASFTTDPSMPETVIIIEYYEADGPAFVNVEITKQS